MATFDTPQPVETSSADLRARVLALINANWTTQAISAAVQLGLPKLIRPNGTRSGRPRHETQIDVR